VDDKTSFSLKINGARLLHIEPSNDLRGPKVQPALLPVPALKPAGRFNSLLVVVRGRTMEVFVNGERVRDPLILNKPLGPGSLRIGIIGDNGPARIEYKRFRVWSLESAGQSSGTK
jgi:hypothetical protein